MIPVDCVEMPSSWWERSVAYSTSQEVFPRSFSIESIWSGNDPVQQRQVINGAGHEAGFTCTSRESAGIDTKLV